MVATKDRTEALVKTDFHLRLGTDPNIRIAPLVTTARKAAITVIHGAGLGRTVALDGSSDSYVIGRAPGAAIHIAEPTVSREHARLELTRMRGGGLQVRVRDLGGRNGTYVNGHAVRDAVLEAGDKVQLGDVILRFDLLDDVDLEYQETIAEKVSEADVDPQTRLFTKRFYMRDLPSRVEEWLDLRLGFALVVIDVDRFKEINDQLGHDAGDRVLAEVGRVILTELRRADIAIRYGGDEMLLALPGTDLPEARVVASRVRIAIRSEAAAAIGSAMPVSASIGVAAHRPGDSLEKVFERADGALLRAKAAGRDRVLCEGDA